MISEKDFEEDAVISQKRTRRHFQSIFYWIPHLLLLATYSGVILTWSKFRPHMHGADSLTNGPVEHWEARFLGTFSEIGDYFNVSTTIDPVPGALAAWQHVQEADKMKHIQRENANYVRINRAYIASTKPGDPQALSHIHRLHCLHVLWRRWHGQITTAETLARIATEDHDSHCFEILRYALMCDDSSLTIKKVGWTGTKYMREGWIDVAPFCEDPELEGVEIGDKNKGVQKDVMV